ncbi:hypothetical protein BDF20DRAFT_836902 [Mycotypha africana]|uniref:uncharacterized protein n=1 Tax=Mycotypha africana TaxID=64632 RepID=UPI0023002FBA|nr:uncharacterized protein BDF20DRAFT_836902 [Mycotypha africana]KAI8975512.1 hypothetical protein BDF20DRAFT_836902 [Mycotypha africana]
MAKKGPNSKAEAANAKKAAAKAEKDKKAAAAAEASEADKWSKGAKKNNKKEEAEAKKAAAAAKKAEAAKLLAEEEKQFTKKPLLKGADKKAAQKSAKNAAAGEARRVIPEFSATGIDDALELLSVDDNGPVKSKDIEKHPERRFKAALTAFEERELPRFKAENPGLRLSQLKELIYKAFQKSPENPFNQANVVAYNATQEEAKSLKDNKKKEVEDRYRTN